MKKSIIAFIVFLGLGLAAMGATGLAVYYPAAPVLMFFFPPPSEWHGDWLWPSTIIAGMAWSFSFLAAGVLHKMLTLRNARIPTKRIAYIAVLWLGALLIWGVILAGQFSST